MSVIIVVVHAVVWTTLGGGLYLLWMNGHETSPLATFARTYNTSRIVGALQDLWMIIGIAVIILILLSMLVPLLEINASIPTSCITPSLQGSAARTMGDSTAMICAPTPQDNPPNEQHAGPDYLLRETSPV